MSKGTGVLVFRATQNKSQKIFIGDDIIEFTMRSGNLLCNIERKGLVTTVSCDSRSDLFMLLAEDIEITLKRQNNQSAVFIKAPKEVKIHREGAVLKTNVDTAQAT